MVMNGNLFGFGMVVLSALLIALPGYLLKLPNAAVMIGVGALLVAADTVIRLMNRGKERWLFNSETGGYLFFVPVWIFGIVVIIANLINALLVKT